VLHQLGAPVSDFVGREREIDQLVQALGKAAASGAVAAIWGMRGMGGIGKTALAYVVAHRLGAAFPEAQLLVELRGASASPMTPAQALQTVIRSFERDAKLSEDLAQLKTIYNSHLHGKRVLILADDAKDAAQMRDLRPPVGCALLITSRNRFRLHGMQTFDLGTLPSAEAEQLLLEICPRIDTSAQELARRCGYLPLALRISATLLANIPSRRVADYLDQLDDEGTRLAQLRDPRDTELNLEASLQLSYDILTDAARTALQQLSVFPASFTLDAACQVLALPAGDAVNLLLEELDRLSLLDYDQALERYSLHDLMRSFAAARLADTDTDADALRLRYARYYAQLAAYAQNDLYLKGAALDGLRLFDLERPHIDAGWAWALPHAGEPDIDGLLLDYVAATVYVALLRYDTRREHIPQLMAWRAAAQRLGDRGAESAALGSLAGDYYRLGEMRRASEYYEQQLTIAREIADRHSEANALGGLGLAYAAQGEVQRAIEYHEQRLAIARAIGDRRGEGTALGNLGLAYVTQGEVQRAIKYYEQDLAITRESGDWHGEAQALGNLGGAYYSLNEAKRALEYYEQQLAIVREIGDLRGEAQALGNLGNAYKNLGEVGRAFEHYEQQLAITRKIGDRRGEGIASWNLGLALEQKGDLARAAELMQVCVDYEREIGHVDAEKDAAQLDQVRQRLAAAQDSPGAA
jgi:tetratricopeptide (TPR) repeat protein